MTNTVVLDLFLGDSGKGKIVDYLSQFHDVAVRFNGSNNAGHTLKVDGKTYKTHALPSGVLHPNTINFIAHGCAIDPLVLLSEIERFKSFNNNIFISGEAHIILPYHIHLDIDREEMITADGRKRSVGSTRRGVAPAFETKCARQGVRYKDLLLPEAEFKERMAQLQPIISYRFEAIEVYDMMAEKLRPHIVPDGVEFLHDLASTKSLLFEGAQGTFLDIDLGDYPFVTSSNCTIGAVLTGTGLNMNQIHEIIGVVKAYGSYVGTNTTFDDIKDEALNNKLCELGQEYGATTGRRRRLCWLDLDAIAKASRINGPTKLAITRMDTLGQLSKVFLKHKGELIEFEPWGDLQGVNNMEQLPHSARDYLEYIEKTLRVPIWAVGVGAERGDLLIRGNL